MYEYYYRCKVKKEVAKGDCEILYELEDLVLKNTYTFETYKKNNLEYHLKTSNNGLPGYLFKFTGTDAYQSLSDTKIRLMIELMNQGG